MVSRLAIAVCGCEPQPPERGPVAAHAAGPLGRILGVADGQRPPPRPSFTCGTMIPWAPRSSTRLMIPGLVSAIRTSGVVVEFRVTRMCSTTSL